jgi:hypothetical protein
MIAKTFTAAALLVLTALGLSACTTAQGSASPPAATSQQSGGGY